MIRVTFHNKPFVVEKPTGNSHSDGFKANIHDSTAARGFPKGMRVCQIPAFTWRSEQAVIALGKRIAAIPVSEEALMLIAKAEDLIDLKAIGMRETAREALRIAGLWPEEVQS